MPLGHRIITTQLTFKKAATNFSWTRVKMPWNNSRISMRLHWRNATCHHYLPSVLSQIYRPCKPIVCPKFFKKTEQMPYVSTLNQPSTRAKTPRKPPRCTETMKATTKGAVKLTCRALAAKTTWATLSCLIPRNCLLARRLLNSKLILRRNCRGYPITVSRPRWPVEIQMECNLRIKRRKCNS